MTRRSAGLWAALALVCTACQAPARATPARDAELYEAFVAKAEAAQASACRAAGYADPDLCIRAQRQTLRK